MGSAESVPPHDTNVKQECINNEWKKGSAGMEELNYHAYHEPPSLFEWF